MLTVYGPIYMQYVHATRRLWKMTKVQYKWNVQNVEG